MPSTKPLEAPAAGGPSFFSPVTLYLLAAAARGRIRAMLHASQRRVLATRIHAALEKKISLHESRRLAEAAFIYRELGNLPASTYAPAILMEGAPPPDGALVVGIQSPFDRQFAARLAPAEYSPIACSIDNVAVAAIDCAEALATADSGRTVLLARHNRTGMASARIELLPMPSPFGAPDLERWMNDELRANPGQYRWLPPGDSRDE
ncbi:hypothetical protein BH09SUM1_BH09SUM1_03610 [soil metagenome]